MKTVVEFLQAAIVTDRQIQNQYPEHYSFFNDIDVLIQQAWKMDDEFDVVNYYEGEKPDQPTTQFELDWIENKDFEADGFYISWIQELA